MIAIAHPYLLSLIGVSIDSSDHVVLVTELFPRGSLSNVLAKEKLSLQLKMKMIKQISFGMHYLHSIRPRIIHRDLKPDNILISNYDSIKIADFGMSRMINQQSNLMTRSGTPHYMAPESISPGKFSEKSDVYSFGIIVWEIYVEKRPYLNVGNPYQIMYKVVNEGLRPEIPQDCPLKDLIADCISTEPSDRPNFKVIIETLSALEEYSSESELNSLSSSNVSPLESNLAGSKPRKNEKTAVPVVDHGQTVTKEILPINHSI